MKGTKFFFFYTSALFEFFKTVLEYWLSKLKKKKSRCHLSGSFKGFSACQLVSEEGTDYVDVD